MSGFHSSFFAPRVFAHPGRATLALCLALWAGPAQGDEIAQWSFDVSLGADDSGGGHDASAAGAPAAGAGVFGAGLALAGDGSHLVVPDDDRLDVRDGLTLAAWVRPERRGSQDVVQKAEYGEVDGYELSLGGDGRVFARLNQASEGKAYKVKSRTPYPTDGQTWMHLAATFDGSRVRLYVDGVLEREKQAPGLRIAANALPLGIGAEPDGSESFQGGIDEVWLYGRALDAEEIGLLITTGAVVHDADDDGVPDEEDAFPDDPSEWADHDGDGVGDNADPDDDDDGLPDAWESEFGLDPRDASDAGLDPDGDGLDNRAEHALGTSPLSADSDADGMPDPWEPGFGLDPLDPADGALDPDGDGLSNAEEYAAGRDPLDRDEDGFQDPVDAFPSDPSEWADLDGDGTGDNADPDDDGDALADAWELAFGLDPRDPGDAGLDPDADGLDNVAEQAAGTSPLSGDSDGDGAGDAADAFPTDPTETADHDGDGVGDHADPDDDGDALPDAFELAHGLDPLDPSDAQLDPDGDGLSSALEYARGTDPTRADSDGDGTDDAGDAFPLDPAETADHDGDGVGDVADPDDDGDRMPDAWEQAHGLDPRDRHDADLDPDDDGLTNLQEFLVGSDPHAANPRLVLRLSFDDPPDGEAVDGSHAGNHGSLNGSATVVPGRFGQALALAGDGSHLRVEDDDSLDLSDGLTLSLWLRADRRAKQQLLEKAEYGDADGYELWLQADGDIMVRFNQASEGRRYRFKAASEYPADGTWMHLAVTFDGETLRIYADGVLDREEPAPELRVGVNSRLLTLGAEHDGDNAFEGALDEVQIYDYALDAEEVAGVMATGTPAQDADGDGVPDLADAFPFDPDEWGDRDGDGLGDFADPDADGDAMPDDWERLHGLDPTDPSDAAADPDGDGVSNADEYALGRHPRDRDEDGVPDAQDAFPDDPTESADLDGDGVGDQADPDDDGDGLPDAWERDHAMDPRSADDAASDVDGDGLDASAEYAGGTSPLVYGAPVAAWLFETDLDGEVPDRGTGAHPAALLGPVAWLESGQGRALDLAAGARAEATPSADLDGGAGLGLALWVLPRAVGDQVLVERDGAGSGGGYALRLGADGRIHASAAADAPAALVSAASYPSDGSWQHLALVHDGAELSLYVDGWLDTSVPAPGALAPGAGPLRMGAGPAGAQAFDGGLDDVHVYGRALAAEEADLLADTTGPFRGAPRLGDCGTAPDLMIAFIGDQGRGDDAREVLELIRDEGAAAVVHSGDFDYDDDPQAWDALITSVLGAGFPYFASVGNHDESDFYGASGYQAFLEQRLARAGQPFEGDLGVQSSHLYQGIQILLVAPGVYGAGNGFHDAYLDLHYAASDRMWRVSSWHKNMKRMQVGGKTDSTGWGVYEASRRAGAIIATAHEHSYSRTHLMSSLQDQVIASSEGPLVLAADDPATGDDEGRSFAFVSGLGGLSVRDQHRDDPWWASIYTSDQDARSGALFGVFHVDGDPRRARFYFKDVAGNVPDAFEVQSAVGSCDQP